MRRDHDFLERVRERFGCKVAIAVGEACESVVNREENAEEFEVEVTRA